MLQRSALLLSQSSRTLAVGMSLAIVLACAAAAAIGAQSARERVEWNKPVEPFRVVGPIYYVGAAGVSAFLIASSDGAILLDGALPETAPQIAANVTKLGFKVTGIRFLLNSHAHFDHAGGLAELKKASGATLVASAGDAPALKSGGAGIPAVGVDRIIADRDTVTLGDTTLQALVTPGHTKGCTTWTMNARDGQRLLRVVFYCSTSVVAPLVGNENYPEIVDDYERSFRTLRELQADVFLANHPTFFELERKRKQMATGAGNPFVDSSELQRFVTSSERAFRAVLAKQR
jgi:metallo-beta-lactamase class B